MIITTRAPAGLQLRIWRYFGAWPMILSQISVLPSTAILTKIPLNNSILHGLKCLIVYRVAQK